MTDEEILERHQKVADKIKDRMKELNLSRKEFAQRLDVTPSTVTKYLSGKHNFTVKSIFDIEYVLHFNIFKYRD